MNLSQVHEEYQIRYEDTLKQLASNVEEHIRDNMKEVARIDRIVARAKNPDRFFSKASKRTDDGDLKYSHPFDQIQDQVGARIVVFYKQDVDIVSAIIERYYQRIERRDLIPESTSEFGYVGKHYILAIPEDAIWDAADRKTIPEFFELQVKTLFQHAWGEAGHDLAYKPGVELTASQKRQVAFTAAQSWGADEIFSQLFSSLSEQQKK